MRITRTILAPAILAVGTVGALIAAPTITIVVPVSTASPNYMPIQAVHSPSPDFMPVQ